MRMHVVGLGGVGGFDPSMYQRTALMQRRALRRSRNVQRLIEQIWEVISTQMSRGSLSRSMSQFVYISVASVYLFQRAL